MQDFFRIEPQYVQMANQFNATKAVKLVHDMHHHARLQAVIDYNAQYEHVKVVKAGARKTENRLTKEQYMMVSLKP